MSSNLRGMKLPTQPQDEKFYCEETAATQCDYMKLRVSFFFFFGYAACGILVPPPGFEPAPAALEAQHLNHWTAREVLE